MNKMPAKLNLLDLPSELRLRVFDYCADEPMFKKRYIGTIARLEVGGSYSGTLAALSYTCKRISNEVNDHLYSDRLFTLVLEDQHREWWPWPAYSSFPIRAYDSNRPDLSFLPHVRSLHLVVVLATPREFAAKSAALEMVLAILTKSTELRIFTLTVNFAPWVTAEQRAERENRLRGLRKRAMKDGEKAGKSVKERQLEFGLRVVEMLKREQSHWLG